MEPLGVVLSLAGQHGALMHFGYLCLCVSVPAVFALLLFFAAVCFASFATATEASQI